MPGLKTVGRVAALAAALPLLGCAAMVGGYDVAPNGLTRDEDAFRRTLAFEAPKAYNSIINGDGTLPEDDLLRLLYAGIAGRYAGAHGESSRLLDVASYLSEDRVSTSLSREALSLLSSDRALAYVPGRTERLMIPYMAALNYLDRRDYQGAAVEARRIEALLDQLHGGTPYEERPAANRFLHLFTAAVFEAAGDWNAADVALRRAGRSQGAGETPWAGNDAGPSGPDGAVWEGHGDVIVLVERGFVPHRVEQSVIVVLPPEQAKMLKDGSVGEKALAAVEAASRILITASHYYGDRSSLYHDPGYRSPIHLEPWRQDRCRDGVWVDAGGRCAEVDDEELGNAYLLRVAWPVLFQEPLPAAPLRVRAGELGADVIADYDLARGIRGDFDDQRATTLARTVARAATKMALASTVEQSIGKRDETAGQIAGFLTNLGTLMSERADTRGWHLLPGGISMVRLRLPAGDHDLTLEASGARSLGTVTVRPGETTFLSTRIWR
jgi:hypothetical protein